ncbi:MAG: DUF1127 domain-containing protein [Hyphomicrobiales bacterium]|nr:DUF1127 domain-containing protein [Hyphomicrobiales bacterium]
MTAHIHKGNSQSIVQRIASGISYAWQTAQARARVRRERQLLATLDDRMLKDIGLTRADANLEAARPSWDVPSCRLPGGKTRDDCPSALPGMAQPC